MAALAEDEEDGAEGFLDALEDVFWIWDDNDCSWFQRRFQGKGKKGKKGKGKKGHGPSDQGKGQGDGKGEANYVNHILHLSQPAMQQAALPSLASASHIRMYA